MKRHVIFSIIFLLLTVLTVSAAQEEPGRYRVKAGETPGGIARLYGITAEVLMKTNGIKNAKKMQTGALLKVPVITKQSSTVKSKARKTAAPKKGPVVVSAKGVITHLGRAPYDIGGSNQQKQIKMLEDADIPEPYKSRFIERYKKGWDPNTGKMREGDFQWEILTGELHPEWMVFKGRRYIKNPPLNLEKAYPARVMSETVGDTTMSIKTPLGCGNGSLFITKVQPPPPAPKPEEKVAIAPEKLETPVVAENPEPETVKLPGLEKFWEAQSGIGHYETVGTDADGNFMWNNFRLWIFETGGLFGTKRILLGPSIGLSFWYGHDRDYEYDGWKWLIGPAIKVDGANWTIDAETRFGRQYGDGSVDRYESSQVDTIWETYGNFSNYARRNAKNPWFPEWSVSVAFTLPLSATNERSESGHSLEPEVWDNQSFSLRFTQSFYDFQLSQKTVMTVKLGVGIGYEGGRDAMYSQIIPSAELRYDGWTVGGVNIMDWKFIDNYSDVYIPVEAWLDWQGVRKAYVDSTVTESHTL